MKKIFSSKQRGPIVMLTAYDAPSAKVAMSGNVDCILVGDSAAMVVHGMAATREASIEMMLLHTRAVRRGAAKLPVIVDLPYKTVQKRNAGLLRDARLLLEAGADAVKIEWTRQAEAQTSALIQNKIPVIGHVGLTPQDLRPGSAFKLRGADPTAAQKIIGQAVRFEALGALAVVVECVPEYVGKSAAERLRIPVIGIGAGRFCDGQVMVFHDLVGLTPDFGARFIKRYAQSLSIQSKAAANFAKEVRARRFPSRRHVYLPVS